MKKEELLAKGISETDADEIISSFSEDVDSSPLLDLQKAVGSDQEDMETLSKAEGEDEEEKENDKDYDEKYMKKYMKRYMKENKEEVGAFGKKMEKAIADIDMESDGAVVEMLDLAPILQDQQEFNSSMAKAIEGFGNVLEVLVSQGEKSYDLMHKAAKVTAEQAVNLDSFLSVPKGRKGVSAANAENMQKAQLVSGDQNKLVEKILQKAVRNGDSTAGQVISAFDSKGKDVNKLNSVQREFINDLINKEDK